MLQCIIIKVSTRRRLFPADRMMLDGRQSLWNLSINSGWRQLSTAFRQGVLSQILDELGGTGGMICGLDVKVQACSTMLSDFQIRLKMFC